MSFEQAVELRQNPLNDDVTGRVVVYFRELQNQTVDTKSTQHDIIIERITSKFHSLVLSQNSTVNFDTRRRPEDVLKTVSRDDLYTTQMCGVKEILLFGPEQTPHLYQASFF